MPRVIDVAMPLPFRYGNWVIDTGYFGTVAYTHLDYDPTPFFADDGPSDNRHGYAPTVKMAMAEIEDIDPMGIPLRVGMRVKCIDGGSNGWGPFIARLVAVGVSGEHGTFEMISGRHRYAPLRLFERHIGYGD
jgi:hypothetical protein